VSRGFEDRAADWIRFARAEGHDAYWAYRDAFFELLPPPPARALEVGCGEGRVTRDLRGRGYEVTGLDVAPTLVEAARDADPSGTYVVGDAAALPFDDASFDLVVSYNSLIDVDDMPAGRRDGGGSPLESYARALEGAGLAIEALREPPLPGVDRHRRMRMPLFLLWRTVKLETRRPD